MKKFQGEQKMRKQKREGKIKKKECEKNKDYETGMF